MKITDPKTLEEAKEVIKGLKKRLSAQAQAITRLQKEKEILEEIVQINKNEAIMSNTVKQDTDRVMGNELTKLNQQLQEQGTTIKSLKDRLRKYEDVD